MSEFEQVRAACGLLIEDESGQGTTRQGTAFLISPTLAITAAHVVADGGPVTLIYSEERFHAEREAVSESNDVAVLRLDKRVEGIQPLPFSRSSPDRVGKNGLIFAS
jgi:S1-C subfamily serine protease